MCDSFERKKEIIKGQIKENTKIIDGIFKLVIVGEEIIRAFENAHAGQFLNIYLDDKSMLLPRPISICDISKNDITLVYRVEGKGTKLLSQYATGAEITVSSPLGNGYTLLDDYEGKKTIVVGGGIGIPPMLELAKELKNRGAQVIAVFGYRDQDFLVSEAKQFCKEVYITSDSGNVGYCGNVVNYLREKDMRGGFWGAASPTLGDYYFACGPKVMLNAIHQYCMEKGKPLWVSLEERMGCGFGACVGCSCNIKVVDEKTGFKKIVKKSVCKDGPVFSSEEVVWE